MVRKLVFIKLILIVFVTFIFQTTTAQEYQKKTIPLARLLDKISNEHKIFFTYSANLLKNKYIQEEGFVKLSLKESISLLKKIYDKRPCRSLCSMGMGVLILSTHIDFLRES